MKEYGRVLELMLKENIELIKKGKADEVYDVESFATCKKLMTQPSEFKRQYTETFEFIQSVIGAFTLGYMSYYFLILIDKFITNL